MVTNLLDTGIVGDGSLRGEIAAAQSGDVINFAPGLAGQTITLTGRELAITKNLDIQGLGADQLTVSGNNVSCVFDITASTTNVQIRDLTITHGNARYNGIYQGGAIYNAAILTVSNCTLSSNSAYFGGGAIDNAGTLTVSNSTLSGNDASSGGAIANTGTLILSNSTLSANTAYANPGGSGGAIYNSGTLTVSNSTLSGNSTAQDGGAIYNSGTVTVSNSTLSGNGAYEADYSYPAAGGGIYMAAGRLSLSSSTISNNAAVGGSYLQVPDYGNPWTIGTNSSAGGLYLAGGTVSIDHCTLAGNYAQGGYGDPGYEGVGIGGGIYNSASQGALQMYDTTLADNSADIAPDLDGSLTSLGHNLIGNSTGGGGFAASDLLNINPQLGPLQNNGGPTQTMALLAGSPAINAGDNTNAPAYDQRGPGFARIVGGTIDIGAFEVQNSSSSQASSLAVSGFPSPTTAGVAGSFTVAAKNADGSIDTGYTGTVHFSSSDGQAVLPADYTFTAADAGAHTFSATLKTAGTQSITAADSTKFGLTGTEGGITVNGAAASTMSVAGFPSSITAGVAGYITVTLKDVYGNLANGYTGTVHFTATDAKAVLPANYTFTAADAGVHTFSAALKTAGSQSITVADTSGLTTTDSGISINAAAASQFVISGPSHVTAGVAFSLTVKVEDAYGNVVTNYTGTVHFASSDRRAILPANYTFAAADMGVHIFTGIVLSTKGTRTITLTDTLNSALTESLVENVN
jgi:hypothetical protein